MINPHSMADIDSKLRTPTWPPVTPFHIHPAMDFEVNSEGDVTEIDFGGGYKMVITGEGEPVKMTDEGLVFSGGQYLEMPLPAILTYDAIAFCGAITAKGGSDWSAKYQVPFSAWSADTKTSTYRRVSRAIEADLGSLKINSTGLPTSEIGNLNNDHKFVMGAYCETRADLVTQEWPSELWINAQICMSLNQYSTINAEKFIVGMDMHGILHEGFAFVSAQGSTDSLLQEGASMRWISETLMTNWNA